MNAQEFFGQVLLPILREEKGEEFTRSNTKYFTEYTFGDGSTILYSLRRPSAIFYNLPYKENNDANTTDKEDDSVFREPMFYEGSFDSKDDLASAVSVFSVAFNIPKEKFFNKINAIKQSAKVSMHSVKYNDVKYDDVKSQINNKQAPWDVRRYNHGKDFEGRFKK